VHRSKTRAQTSKVPQVISRKWSGGLCLAKPDVCAFADLLACVVQFSSRCHYSDRRPGKADLRDELLVKARTDSDDWNWSLESYAILGFSTIYDAVLERL